MLLAFADEADEFSYWNFFLDWGPLSLGNLFRFCRTLNFKLKSERLRGKAIYVYSGSHAHKRTNAAFLLSSWLLLYGGRTPEQDVFPPFPPFHDASPCVCTFDLTIPHCLGGLQKAFRFGFFDFTTFDVEEYEHYEQVENGDLNWLVDGKFLAFAGPHNRSEMTREGYRTLTPRNYIPYFKKHNVTLVVRLNKKYYDEQLFLDAGIDHLEAYFPDGSVPSPNIVRQFISACEATPGAVAVHCKAGLGRTGTCIGCYIMKHYSFSAAEVIGWMRVCRPGSVIGPQQHYLERMEGPMHREGLAFRERAGQFSSPRRTLEDHSPRRGDPGEQRGKHATSGGAPCSAESRAVIGNVMGNVMGNNGREGQRGFEPASKSTCSAASTGGHPPSARTPRHFAASLGASAGGNNNGITGKEEPSPRRSSFSPDRQSCRNADSGTRRKSTSSLNQPQPQAPLSSFGRGDGVEGMSRNLTQLGSKQGGGKGRGVGGGAACGRTASVQRDRQAIGNTGLRRASAPSGRVAGSFAQVSPAGKRLANAAASLNAAAEAGAARGGASLDAWGEIAAAGVGGAERRGWTLGGRTQGDYLLQQRARGGGNQASRR